MLLNNIAMVDLHRAFSDAAAVLSCKICLGRLQKPVFLKICRHTFCEECISKVYLSADIKFCPYCKNQEPENKIISADYDRDKLEAICAMLLQGITKDFGHQVSQQVGNSSNIGMFSNFDLRGVTTDNYREPHCGELVEKLDNNKVNTTLRVESSSVADPNTSLEHPVEYSDLIKAEMKDDENNEITNFEHEDMICEPLEKRRCELFNEGNISAEQWTISKDYITQNGSYVTTDDIKTEMDWEKW